MPTPHPGRAAHHAGPDALEQGQAAAEPPGISIPGPGFDAAPSSGTIPPHGVPRTVFGTTERPEKRLRRSR